MAQLKHVIDINRPNVLVLMETRINSSKARKFICKINFPNFVEIAPKGYSGGNWLLWKENPNFYVKVLKTHSCFIHCLITDNRAVPWLATFVYGYPYQHLQKYV